MPSMNYYLVTEVRQVRVTAESPVGALEIGQAAFEGKDEPEYTTGRTVGTVTTMKLEAVRD